MTQNLDGSKDVSKQEFETLGFLFNFSPAAIRRIYQEFDISGKSELSYDDFELFVLAAIELQASLDRNEVKGTQTLSLAGKLFKGIRKALGLEES